jgi:hypothetical protein
MINKEMIVCYSSHAERSRSISYAQSFFDSAQHDYFSYLFCMIPDSYIIKFPNF